MVKSGRYLNKERRKAKGDQLLLPDFFFHFLFFSFLPFRRALYTVVRVLHGRSTLQIFTRYSSKHKQRKKTHGMVGKHMEKRRYELGALLELNTLLNSYADLAWWRSG
jgi:hypothetical protein